MVEVYHEKYYSKKHSIYGLIRLPNVGNLSLISIVRMSDGMILKELKGLRWQNFIDV